MNSRLTDLTFVDKIRTRLARLTLTVDDGREVDVHLPADMAWRDPSGSIHMDPDAMAIVEDVRTKLDRAEDEYATMDHRGAEHRKATR